MNFILSTLPHIINSWVLGPLMTYVIGPSMFFLPPAVKEHFSGNALRLLSFLFLIILLNGTVRFIFLLLTKFFNIAEMSLMTKIFDTLKRKVAFFRKLEEVGYSEGYVDGLYNNISKVWKYDYNREYNQSSGSKLRKIILSLIYLFVSIEMILAVYVAM